MDQSYKIVLFGNNIYQEIELFGENENGIKIGTTKSCKVRYSKEFFFEDFEIEVLKTGNEWKIVCGDSLYIVTDGVMKQYSVDLLHGDEVSVKYQSSNIEIFKVTFLIDFDRQIKNYDRVIDIGDKTAINIGGREYCDIFISDELVGEDTILLKVENNQYTLVDNNTKYGVCVNGFRLKSPTTVIHDYDFFMLDGYDFYVRDKKIYTSILDNKKIRGLTYTDYQEQNNQMEYPKFQRNSRVHLVIPDEKIDILPPKEKPQPQQKNFLLSLIPTAISMVVMIGLRSAMGRGGLFVVYSGVMMGMGIITSIITYRTQGKQYREDMQKREEEYTKYAKEKEEKIKELRKKELEVLQEIHISPEREIKTIMDFDKSLFEKDKLDEDYLSIRIGQGTVPAKCEISFKPQEFKDTSDQLLNYPEMLCDAYKNIENAPVTIDLKKVNALGIVGNRDKLFEMLKNITIDLASRNFFEDIKFFYIFNEESIEKFKWIRWLRNTKIENSPIRNFMYNEQSKKVILEFLYGELSRREAIPEKEREALADFVVFVYDREGLSKHPVSKYIKECNTYKFTFIFFDEYEELIPRGCDNFIYLNENNTGVLTDCKDKDNSIEFTYSFLSDKVVSSAALRLGCVYVDNVSLESRLTSNISLYKLLGIMSADDLDIEKRWATSQVYKSMAAPLGVKSNDEIVALDLNEKHHGPHGLVAGTTGSGKSEILQSYILSMATLFHPYEVSFVIIDFKGGGMVNQFKNLPHLIGSITNIDGREIDRSLLSIKAELKKRQAVFAKHNVNHIDSYIKLFKNGEATMPLPHLILIVDEFAELKSDQPEFMKELISAARIGRSLGVHLILATQKPSGVVDDQIWSNSKFKLCLKVQNKNDSNEVLKSPLAAEIKEPGRAYLQVGNNEIFELFQSAYSGADINADKMGNQREYAVYKMNLLGQREVVFQQKKEKNKETINQLDAIVNYIGEYCSKNNIEKLPGICLPSLQEIIDFENVVRKSEVESDINISIGVYDDPENQLQDNVFINITQNNTFILGSSQYGKTNMLQTIIKALALKYTPKEVNIYILDFASMILKTFTELNHVGGVIISSEDEKMKNFFKMINEEIAKRKEILSKIGISSFSAYRDAGYDDLPQIVIMVDNITALKELYLANEDYMLPICREGLSVGVSIIFANSQMSGIGYKYLSNFSMRIALYCNDSSEYSSLYDSCRMKNRNIPGRGMIEIDKKIYEFQSYLSFKGVKEIDRVKEVKNMIAEINKKYDGITAYRIPEIPNVFTREIAEKQYSDILHKAYNVLFGMNYQTVEPISLNMLELGTLALFGRKGMGKSNFVRVVIKALYDNRVNAPVKVHIFDDISRKYQAFENNEIVEQYTLNAEEIIKTIISVEEELKARYEKIVLENDSNYLKTQPYIFILVQNRDAIDILSKSKEAIEKYKNILSKYKNMKVGIIYSNIENIAIPYSAPDVMKMLKESKHFMCFDDMANEKVVDVPMNVAKAYRKKIQSGDGYYIKDAGFGKIKYLKND